MEVAMPSVQPLLLGISLVRSWMPFSGLQIKAPKPDQPTTWLMLLTANAELQPAPGSTPRHSGVWFLSACQRTAQLPEPPTTWPRSLMPLAEALPAPGRLGKARMPVDLVHRKACHCPSLALEKPATSPCRLIAIPWL